MRSEKQISEELDEMESKDIDRKRYNRVILKLILN